MLLKNSNTLNYPILFWNIAKFFEIVFRYFKHLDRLCKCLQGVIGATGKPYIFVWAKIVYIKENPYIIFRGIMKSSSELHETYRLYQVIFGILGRKIYIS
jgi:hypothetical protein